MALADHGVLRVVLAEDEEMFAEIAVSALESHGYPMEHLSVADDGVQALSHIDRLQAEDPTVPILAFLDVRMPNLDGESVAQRIREEPKVGCRTPFLVCCSANVATLTRNTEADLFNMTMPKNFTDAEAVLACFQEAEAYFGIGPSSACDGPVEIIIADDEPICSVALSASVCGLGLEEPCTADDPETMVSSLQEAQCRQGPLMLLVGNTAWLSELDGSLIRKPFLVDASVEKSGSGCHIVLESQTQEAISHALDLCKTWWLQGCP